MANNRQIIAAFIALSFIAVASGVDAADVGPTATTSQPVFTVQQTVLPTLAPSNQAGSLTLTQADLDKGREAPFFGGDLLVTFLPKIWQGTPMVTVVETSAPQLPWKLKLVSKVYEIKVVGGTFKDGAGLAVRLSYADKGSDLKQLYLFDTASSTWKALPSTDLIGQQKIQALVKSANAKIAVFVNPGVLTSGKASWYSYKPGLFCASPDFTKGSKLRVTNLATGKSIEVVVNDWGPERKLHPDRVVDLSKEAFKALSPLSAGVIKVAVSPIELAPDTNGRVMGVKEEGVGPAPKLASRSALILNEISGEVLLSKNSSQIMPIASLSKIVAVSVFLKFKPDLKTKMVYRSKDAAFNALYAPAYESAGIKLKDGDQVLAKDFVYASLVASANNAVESLVRNSGLTREQFIAEMNKQAAKWGATSTHFVEPTGLSPKNVSTVQDYALLTKEAFKNDVVQAATVSSSYTVKVANRKAQFKLKNTDKLIVDQAQENLKLEDLGINGSKTGYLEEAGYCLMTRVKSANGQFIIVTFGAPTRQTSFNEMMDLIKYANLKS